MNTVASATRNNNRRFLILMLPEKKKGEKKLQLRGNNHWSTNELNCNISFRSKIKLFGLLLGKLVGDFVNSRHFNGRLRRASWRQTLLENLFGSTVKRGSAVTSLRRDVTPEWAERVAGGVSPRVELLYDAFNHTNGISYRGEKNNNT